LDGAQTVKDLGKYLGVEKPSATLPEQVKAGQAKAQKGAQARTALEASVSADRPADTELLANYMAYINYEEVNVHLCSENYMAHTISSDVKVLKRFV
jgi:hypothetical protein